MPSHAGHHAKSLDYDDHQEGGLDRIESILATSQPVKQYTFGPGAGVIEPATAAPGGTTIGEAAASSRRVYGSEGAERPGTAELHATAKEDAPALSLVEIIREAPDATAGCVGGILMDFNGIPVDRYARSEGSDMEALGSEFSGLLRDVQRVNELLDAGEPVEISVRSEKSTTLVRILNQEYFFALAVDPSGNVEHAWSAMRAAATKLLLMLRASLPAPNPLV
ncbi:MAG: hypothetical protein JW940_29290 [Polyangiaceae bacterium]|nr:hypothetical protein [Polyangiaceae bacterium]